MALPDPRLSETLQPVHRARGWGSARLVVGESQQGCHEWTWGSGKGQSCELKKNLGQRTVYKAFLMPLSRDSTGRWGRAQGGSVRPQFCSMTLGNLCHLSERQLPHL